MELLTRNNFEGWMQKLPLPPFRDTAAIGGQHSKERGRDNRHRYCSGRPPESVMRMQTLRIRNTKDQKNMKDFRKIQRNGLFFQNSRSIFS